MRAVVPVVLNACVVLHLMLPLRCSENVQRLSQEHMPTDPETMPEEWAEEEVRGACGAGMWLGLRVPLG